MKTLNGGPSSRGTPGVRGGTVEGSEAETSWQPARDARGRFLPGPRPGRPARRRPGGQLGNISATRHPWRVYWRRRALKPEERWALQLVADYLFELIADKGGESEVTAGERRLMETGAAARVCWLLAIAHPSPESSRAEAARFMSVERQCLEAVGLEKRQQAPESYQARLARLDRERKSAQTQAKEE